MKIRCVLEHNGDDSLLFAENFVGAFTRGKDRETALNKMPSEILNYLNWCNLPSNEIFIPEIVQIKQSELNIADADTDVIFNSEILELSESYYEYLKSLALKSACDFYALYKQIPDKDKSCIKPRKTFYGITPVTAREMYEHTKNVNSYYFGEIGVKADDYGSISECREKGFLLLENKSDYLSSKVYKDSYNEQWSLRKVLRRFIWHDRIHAKAMYRMAINTFGENSVENIFKF